MSTNLKNEAEKLEECWSPKVLGQVNDQYVKVAKLKGELAWHKHDLEDELFLVLAGNLRIEYEDHVVDLKAGEFHVVPKGCMHNPTCDSECLIALIETRTTQHTGDVAVRLALLGRPVAALDISKDMLAYLGAKAGRDQIRWGLRARSRLSGDTRRAGGMRSGPPTAIRQAVQWSS